MYKSMNIKCADCKDIFRAEYDSRKVRQNEYACKCGKLVCTLGTYGGFSYKSGGHYEKMSLEEIDTVVEYYEEDYIEFSDEANSLISEIIELGKYINKNMIGAYFSNFTNEDQVCFVLKNYDVESISIEARVTIRNNMGWKYDREKQENRLLESLSRFKDVLIKVKDGELDLGSPRAVCNNEDLEWHDCAMKQLELYDYTLYC